MDNYAYQAPFGRRTGGLHGLGVYLCADCGKRFATTRQMEGHERLKCKTSKRGLSEMLAESKAMWQAKKKRRLELLDNGLDSQRGNLDLEVAVPHNVRFRYHLLCDKSGTDGYVQQDLPCGNHVPTPLGLEPNAEAPPTPPASSSALLNAAAAPVPAMGGEQMHPADPLPLPAHSSPPLTGLNLPIANRKAGRQRRLPKRFQEDDVPAAPPKPQAPNEAIPAETTAKPSGPPACSPRVLAPSVSNRDKFGVSKIYEMPGGLAPSHDPDQTITLKDLTNTPPKSKPEPQKTHLYGPFPNASAFSLAEWYWNSNKKSLADFQRLMKVFGDPEFRLVDTLDLNWKGIFHTLGANKSDLPEDDGEWIQDEGWKTTPIHIDVPFHNRMKDPGVKSFFAGNLRHRSVLSVIKEKITNEHDSRQFHYYPYRATWKPTESSPEVDLYGEVYASQAFRDAHEEVQGLALAGADPEMERVVIALMFWSDSTHLTSFGPASLWPCYLFFGNESKYRRCQPSQGLCQHVAYFQKMPDKFTDYLKERNSGKMPTDTLFAHCSREIFQKQWAILLDQELVNAMKDGLCLVCPDGRRRLFFPRVFTYSADYPEKTLIAGVRQNGSYPCPRCLVAKSDMWKLGAPNDVERVEKQRDEHERCRLVSSARQDILKHGYAVASKAVETKLKPLSLVPVVNAFSSALASFSYSIIPSLVVDQMHEFEIGVWKRLLIHLIRLLNAFTVTNGPTLTAELDARFRATPSFGRDGIRKFGLNASSMKRKAARDYEDLLQCAIPAFESLLPAFHDSILMSLLFICAQWHALAKLRLHNDLTLKLLEHTTTLLGAHMRCFDQETCAKTPTKELAKEAEARARHEGKGKGSTARKPVGLNMYTIKFHFLGDYPSMIRKYGTTDSYTTEVGELCHREPKSWYERTDKKEFERQIAQIERRQARLAAIRERLSTPHSKATGSPIAGTSQAPREALSPDSRYTIALSQSIALDLSSSFIERNPGTIHQDHYLVNFIPCLKQHLLPRIIERLGVNPGEIGSETWPSVVLKGNRLYSHQILHCNYTTYDVRRDDDVIHVNTPQCNLMTLNADYHPQTWAVEHPYLYARALGIYHAMVSYIGILPDGTRRYGWHKIEFLWVHWYDMGPAAGEFRLDLVVPAPLSSAHALGFLDPSDVLRGVHLIPRFGSGKIRSVRSRLVKTDNIWREYHINRFTDRDMFMRYQFGMSVGHTYMKSNFPPPETPSLPADMNLYLTNPLVDQPDIGGAAASPSGVVAETPSTTATTSTQTGQCEPSAQADSQTNADSAEDLDLNVELEDFVDDDDSNSWAEDREDYLDDEEGAGPELEDLDDEVPLAEEREDYMEDMNDEEFEAYYDMYYDDEE